MVVIMLAFPKSYDLRFIAERTDDYSVLSRELVRRNHFLTSAHETCRFEFYDVSALPIEGDVRVADVVFDLFMDAARKRVLAEHPECAADVALLADSAALASGKWRGGILPWQEGHDDVHRPRDGHGSAVRRRC